METRKTGVTIKTWQRICGLSCLIALLVTSPSNAQPATSGNVDAPHQLQGPRVAANPQDKWVLTLDSLVLVVTQDGGVFAHDISGSTIGVPHEIPGAKVAANPQDKWVLVLDHRIFVITQDGRVFAHDVGWVVDPNNPFVQTLRVGIPYQLSGPKVAANPQDKWVVTSGGSIFVITQDGGVFAHDITGNNIGIPYQISGSKVAANPQDKWVFALYSNLPVFLVITQDGGVFGHMLTPPQCCDGPPTGPLREYTIDKPSQLPGSKVAANAQDKRVLFKDGQILVITNDGRVFSHGLQLPTKAFYN